MSHLIQVTDAEWIEAQAFFDKEDKKQKAAEEAGTQRILEIKFKNRQKAAHSFIRINGQIFAVANKNAAGLKGHLLGEGAFGKVRMVQTKEGDNFAVKIEARGIRGEQDAETKIMKILGYLLGEGARSILEGGKKFKDSENITEKLYTITQRRVGDELFKYLYLDAEGTIRKEADPTKSAEELLKEKLIIALNACNAIQALHEKNIIHGDIKPQNFMIDSSGDTIIVESVDYGCSLILTPPATTVLDVPQGTPFFMAPETKGVANMHGGQGVFSFASDVFALGMMFGEDLQLDQDLNINKLIEEMTERYPSRRPPMDKIIKAITLAIQNPTIKPIKNDIKSDVESGKHDTGKYDTTVRTPEDMVTTVRTPEDMATTVRTPEDMATTVRTPEDMATTVKTPEKMATTIQTPASPVLAAPPLAEPVIKKPAVLKPVVKKPAAIDINDQLIQAITDHKLITVIELLKAGADPNATNKNSNEPILMLAIRTIPAYKEAPKQVSAMHNDIIQSLIEQQKDTNLNYRNKDGNTILMLAISNKASPAIINSLINKESNIDNKKDALALATQQNQTEIISLLTLAIHIPEFTNKWNEDAVQNAYLSENRNIIPKINPFLHLFKQGNKISDTRSEQLTRLSGAIAALAASKSTDKIHLILHVFQTIGYMKAQLKNEHNWLGSRLSKTLNKIEKDLTQTCPPSLLNQKQINAAKQEGAGQYKQELLDNNPKKKRPSL